MKNESTVRGLNVSLIGPASPLRIFFLLLTVLICIEMLIMTVLPLVIEDIYGIFASIADASLLTITSAPFLWFLIVRPLRRSEERYRSLFSSLQEGLCLFAIVYDAAGRPVDYRYLEANSAYERLFGVSRDRLIGRTLKEVFPETEEWWLNSLASVARTGNPTAVGNYSKTHNRYFEMNTYSPVMARQIAVIVSDVTERKSIQEEREKTDRLESLGFLAGGIAHDFNNILTAVVGNISLARTQLGEEHRANERLAACENALARATDLTKQLLTFARGGAPLKKVVDAEQLIREVVSFALRGSNSRGEINLFKELWHLDADVGQLHQALNNLVINAAQAMPGGGIVTIHAANESIGIGDHHDLSPGSYVKITVTDQGCGIPQEILPKIFDPYFTTKPTGTGLGLASVYSIVKRHGGEISVSSTPGSGTSFALLLPAAAAVEVKESVMSEQMPPPSAGAAILVMDDEEMVRSIAAAMLKELGYRAVTCPDGAEAVSLYRDYRERGEPFAGVILDMTVTGGMGGMEAGRQIRASDPEAVLIISSGYSVDPVIDETGDTLFRGMVAKPYNLAKLARELTRVMSSNDMLGGGVAEGCLSVSPAPASAL